MGDLVREAWCRKGHPVDPVTLKCRNCGEATEVDLSRTILNVNWRYQPLAAQRMLNLSLLVLQHVGLKHHNVEWKPEEKRDQNGVKVVILVNDHGKMHEAGWVRYNPATNDYQLRASRDGEENGWVELLVRQVPGSDPESPSFTIEASNGEVDNESGWGELFDSAVLQFWAKELLLVADRSKRLKERDEEKKHQTEVYEEDVNKLRWRRRLHL